MSAAGLASLQKSLGYSFRNSALLAEALTHGSYLQEHPGEGAHNQRLEFLGDAVLHLILTGALFAEFSVAREGLLSRWRAALTNGVFLSRLARDLGVDAHVRLGESEEAAGGRKRDSLREDTIEALVGAIYLDSDFATTRKVVLEWYGPLAPRLAAVEDVENPKGRLQELIQPGHGNDALRYEVASTSGPRHARNYEVAVFLNTRQLGSGHGSSKKTAEEEAARVALVVLRQEAGADGAPA